MAAKPAVTPSAPAAPLPPKPAVPAAAPVAATPTAPRPIVTPAAPIAPVAPKPAPPSPARACRRARRYTSHGARHGRGNAAVVDCAAGPQARRSGAVLARLDGCGCGRRCCRCCDRVGCCRRQDRGHRPSNHASSCLRPPAPAVQQSPRPRSRLRSRPQPRLSSRLPTTAPAPAAAKPAAPPVAAPAPDDDLTRIRGIDRDLAAKLIGLGVRRYADIANWKRNDISCIADRLGMNGRVERENWIEQAQVLAKGGETDYSRRWPQAAMTLAKPTGNEGEKLAISIPQPAVKAAQRRHLPHPSSAAPAAIPAISDAAKVAAAAATAAATAAAAAVKATTALPVQPAPAPVAAKAAAPVAPAPAGSPPAPPPPAAAVAPAIKPVAPVPRSFLLPRLRPRSRSLRRRLLRATPAAAASGIDDLTRIRGIDAGHAKEAAGARRKPLRDIAKWGGSDVARINHALRRHQAGRTRELDRAGSGARQGRRYGLLHAASAAPLRRLLGLPLPLPQVPLQGRRGRSLRLPPRPLLPLPLRRPRPWRQPPLSKHVQPSSPTPSAAILPSPPRPRPALTFQGCARCVRKLYAATHPRVVVGSPA